MYKLIQVLYRQVTLKTYMAGIFYLISIFLPIHEIYEKNVKVSLHLYKIYIIISNCLEFPEYSNPGNTFNKAKAIKLALEMRNLCLIVI